MSNRGYGHVTGIQGQASLDQFYIDSTESLFFHLLLTQDKARALVLGTGALPNSTNYNLTGLQAYFRLGNPAASTIPVNVLLTQDNAAQGLVSGTAVVRTGQFTLKTYANAGVYVVDPSIVDSATPSGHQEFIHGQEWQAYISPRLDDPSSATDDGVVFGPQGWQGPSGGGSGGGNQGFQGFQGNQGNLGAQGAQGIQGAQGSQGATGTTGAVGAQGVQGYQGAQGAVGTTGNTGAQGNQGWQGNQGNQGLIGVQGAQGLQGLQGNQGFQGRQGWQGNQGNQGPVGTPTFADILAGDLAENQYAAFEDALTADGKYTGLVLQGTAGTTLAFGDLIYLAVADSRWELADADAAATAGDVLLGICVLAAAADGNATRILLIGTVRADTAFPTLTVGAPVYVSTTAGDVQVAQPSGTDDVIRVLGMAITADSMYFNPSMDYITHT